MDKKKYVERLKKFDDIFYNVCMEVIMDADEEDIDLFDEKMIFFEIYTSSNIDLKGSKVLKHQETSYDIDYKRLFVNEDDSIEYIDYVIMYSVFEKLLDEVEFPTTKTKVKALYALLSKLGLIKYYSNNLSKGSNHIMISALAKVFLESNK